MNNDCLFILSILLVMNGLIGDHEVNEPVLLTPDSERVDRVVIIHELVSRHLVIEISFINIIYF
jgi:hypothetical protein